MKKRKKIPAALLIAGSLIFLSLCEITLGIYASFVGRFFKESFDPEEVVPFETFDMSMRVILIFSEILIPFTSVATILMAIYLILDYKKNN